MVVPASVWIAGCAVVTGDYRITTAFYLNGWLNGWSGPTHWTADWQFWFLEALVWAYLAVAALLSLRRVDSWQRAYPFATAMVVVAGALLARYLLVGVEAEGTEKYSLAVVLWVLALGWAAAEARTVPQRVLVAATSVAGLLGFFGDLQRELLVAGSVVLLLWARPVPLPRVLARVVEAVASASLWIYLTHWQVYPELEAAGHAPAAILASVAVGIACSTVYAWGSDMVRRPHAKARPAIDVASQAIGR